jgi:anti-anti-sigma regulatory factor
MPAKSQKQEAGETVAIVGRLDRSVEAADRLLAADQSDIVIDFSQCSFVTVDGLEWLEELMLRASSKKHTVSFTGIPPSIYKVFKVSHIDGILRACGAPAPRTKPSC